MCDGITQRKLGPGWDLSGLVFWALIRGGPPQVQAERVSKCGKGRAVCSDREVARVCNGVVLVEVVSELRWEVHWREGLALLTPAPCGPRPLGRLVMMTCRHACELTMSKRLGEAGQERRPDRPEGARKGHPLGVPNSQE